MQWNDSLADGYRCPCLVWARIARSTAQFQEHDEFMLACMYCGVRRSRRRARAVLLLSPLPPLPPGPPPARPPVDVEWMWGGCGVDVGWMSADLTTQSGSGPAQVAMMSNAHSTFSRCINSDGEGMSAK